MFTEEELKDRIATAHRRLDDAEDKGDDSKVKLYANLLHDYFQELRLLRDRDTTKGSTAVGEGTNSSRAAKDDRKSRKRSRSATPRRSRSRSEDSGRRHRRRRSREPREASTSRRDRRSPEPAFREQPTRSLSGGRGDDNGTSDEPRGRSRTYEPLKDPRRASSPISKQIAALECKLPRSYDWEWNRHYKRYVCAKWARLRSGELRAARQVSFNRRRLEDPDVKIDYQVEIVEDGIMLVSLTERLKLVWDQENSKYTCPGFFKLPSKRRAHIDTVARRRFMLEQLREADNLTVDGLERRLTPPGVELYWNAGVKAYKVESTPGNQALSEEDKEMLHTLTEMRRALEEAVLMD